jgi:hypothetical protein
LDIVYEWERAAMKMWRAGGLLLMVMLLGAHTALAQKSGYAFAISLPASYKFTKDQTTNQAPPSKSPRGFQLMLDTPIHLGIGFGSYKSGFADPNPPWVARDIKYDLIEVQYTIPISIVLLGIGGGFGSAEFKPATATFGPIVQDFKKSKAKEWLLMLGVMLGDAWDVRATLHGMVINADLETNGVPSSGDVGAFLWTLGVGYHY